MVYGIKQSKSFFFLVEQMFGNVLIQISLIKNNPVNLIIDLYVSLTTYIHHH